MPHNGFNQANYAPALVILNEFGGPVIGTLFSAVLTYTVIEGGVQLTYAITNTSGTHQRWPAVWLPTGWSNDAGGGDTDPLSRYWYSHYRFQAFATPVPWSQYWDRVYGINMFSACVAFDNLGSAGTPTTFGWSTDYPYIFDVSLQSTDRIVLWPGGGYTSYVPRIVDIFAPGETKTIRFWLKTASGTGTASALSAVRPYTEWMRSAYPYDPPAIPHNARFAGLNIAQHEASTNPPHADGTRQYWTRGGLKPDQFSGWYTFLDALVADVFGTLANFKSKGNTGLILWAASGYESENPDNFFPAVVRALPPNLYRTLSEVPKWIKDRKVSVGLWLGRAMSGVQAGNSTWNGEVRFVLEDGYYEATFDGGGVRTGYVRRVGGYHSTPQVVGLSDFKPYKLTKEAVSEFEQNIAVALTYFDGIGLDAVPDPTVDSWILARLRAMRKRFPTKWFAAESQRIDKMLGAAVTWFSFGGASSFTGVGGEYGFDVRCPLQEAIYPGHRAFVSTYWNSNLPAMAQDVQTIEAADHVPVIMALPLSVSSALPTRLLKVRDSSGHELTWGGANVALGAYPVTPIVPPSTFKHFEELRIPGKPNLAALGFTPFTSRNVDDPSNTQGGNLFLGNVLPVGFRFFDSLGIQGKPNLTGLGFTPITYRNVVDITGGAEGGNLFSGNLTDSLVVNQARVNWMVDQQPAGESWLAIDCEDAIIHLDIFRIGTTPQKNNLRDGMVAAKAAIKARAIAMGKVIHLGWYSYPNEYWTTINHRKNPGNAGYTSEYNAYLASLASVVEGLASQSDIHDFVDPQCYAFYGNGSDVVADFDLYMRDLLAAYRVAYPGVPMYTLALPYFLEAEPWAGKPLGETITRNIMTAATQLSDGIIWFEGQPSVRPYDYIYNVPSVAALQAVNNGSIWTLIQGVRVTTTGLNFTGCADLAACATVLQTAIRAAYAALPPTSRPFDLGTVITITGSGSTLLISVDANAPGVQSPPDAAGRVFLVTDAASENQSTGLIATGKLVAAGISYTGVDAYSWIKWVAGGIDNQGTTYPERDWWRVVLAWTQGIAGADGLSINTNRVNWLVDHQPAGESWLQIDCEGSITLDIFSTGTEAQMTALRFAMVEAKAAIKARGTSVKKNIHIGWYSYANDYQVILDYAKNTANADNASAHEAFLQKLRNVVTGLANQTLIHDFTNPQCYAFKGNDDAAIGDFNLYMRQLLHDYGSVYKNIPMYALGLPNHLEIDPYTGKPLSGALVAVFQAAARELANGDIWFDGDPSIRYSDFIFTTSVAALKTVTNGTFFIMVGGVRLTTPGMNFSACNTLSECATVLQTGIRAAYAGLPSQYRPLDLGNVVTVVASGSTTLLITADITPSFQFPPDSGVRSLIITQGSAEDPVTGLVATGKLVPGYRTETSSDPAAWIKWVAGGVAGGSYPAREWWTQIVAGMQVAPPQHVTFSFAARSGSVTVSPTTATGNASVIRADTGVYSGAARGEITLALDTPTPGTYRASISIPAVANGLDSPPTDTFILNISWTTTEVTGTKSRSGPPATSSIRSTSVPATS